MASLILSTAGSAIGGAVLPQGLSILGTTISGAAIGGALGSVAGSFIDQALFARSGVTREGPRLADLNVQASTEGAPIPRLYGRGRLAGQVIWATKFKETISTREVGGGGKGGGGGSSSTVQEYSYSASLAIGLAEGPITRIGRVWADGKPLSLNSTTHRVYRGSEIQNPDSLIEAVEGAGKVPAYRGIAYIVLENLELAPFGNRVPQLTFEIFRSLSDVEKGIKAVAINPGSTEFGYDTVAQRQVLGAGVSRSENVNNAEAIPDWTLAINQLEETCVNCDAASLVVSWFGDDLRCGVCTIRPKVENHEKITTPNFWQVSDLTRATAQTVSTVDGRPAFGGTPSDLSVVRAIQDLKARGLRVLFYPFLLMDIPAGNTLTDPYTGAASQPVYPWRGRMTSDPAPGQPGTPDKTVAAANQVAVFFGSAAVSDFVIVGEAVGYTGPAEWSFRRMVLHYAHLCKAAGGVDAFVIGSELRGLTQLRDSATTYPTVAQLKTLAADVSSVLGATTKISYAADWSEYFGHQPTDGSNDVFFHLDPLWADANIDFIGIDNYMPLSDWRDGTAHLDAQAGVPNIYDLDYLKSNIAGGEGYDWFYASDADRTAQIRTTITDGAHNKPWVFRYKDLKSWWSNQHFNRPGGVESISPTAWTPQAKPIWFTETGAPAVDKATNQPNVFVDPKSSESELPHFSNANRDDYIQRRFIEAVTSYWDTGHADYVAGSNPISSVYSAPMVDIANMYLWTWDARPYPAFPQATAVWSDGPNWKLGHWITGRLGAAPLSDLVTTMLADVGFTSADAAGLTGVVDGFVIDRIMSPRQAIEPLMLAFFFDAVETGGLIRMRHLGSAPVATLDPADLVVEEEQAAPGYLLTRGQETELPVSVKFTYIDGVADYRQAAVESRRLVVGSQRVVSGALPIVLRQDQAQIIADIWLQNIWVGRESATLKLSPSRLALDPGDVVTLTLSDGDRDIRLTSLTDTVAREVRATVTEASVFGPLAAPDRAFLPSTGTSYGAPYVKFMDLPVLTGKETPHAPRIAASATPWPGGVAVYRSATSAGFQLDRIVGLPAIMGTTLTDLQAGPTSRWDYANTLTVKIAGGALASADRLTVLAGANTAAVENVDGEWEILQFQTADLTGTDEYQLSGLLRGQAGTETAMRTPVAAGASWVLIDAAVEELGLTVAERGLTFNWRYGPAPLGLDDATYVTESRSFAGVGLRPLSPVHVRAARQANGDISLSWIRRTRIDGDSWEAVEVPLAEENELYDITIMSGATPIRTLTATTPSALYVAADQISDFGSSTFPTLSLVVYQVSQAFGRGAGRGVTLNV